MKIIGIKDLPYSLSELALKKLDNLNIKNSREYKTIQQNKIFKKAIVLARQMRSMRVDFPCREDET